MMLHDSPDGQEVSGVLLHKNVRLYIKMFASAEKSTFFVRLVTPEGLWGSAFAELTIIIQNQGNEHQTGDP